MLSLRRLNSDTMAFIYHVHEENIKRKKRQRKCVAFSLRKNFPGCTNKKFNNIVKQNILSSMVNLMAKNSAFLI